MLHIKDLIVFDYSDLMKGRHRAYPNRNYLSGDGKSIVWNGHQYYSPVNRSWQVRETRVDSVRVKCEGLRSLCDVF